MTLHPALWALGVIALFIFEVGVNIVAEISDKNEGVFVTQEDTWIPTGPFLINRTGIGLERMLRYAALVFAIAGIIGIYLAAVTGFIVILSIGIAGFLLTIIYAVPPFMLGFRGIGEPVPFIAFGPLPGIALYFLMTGNVSLTAAAVTLPAAFWITAVRYAHHLPDRSTKSGARFEGMHRKRVEHASAALATFACLGALSVFILLPIAGALVLLPLTVTIALTYPALRNSMRANGNAVGISGGTRYYALLHLAGSISMAVAMLFA